MSLNTGVKGKRGPTLSLLELILPATELTNPISPEQNLSICLSLVISTCSA